MRQVDQYLLMHPQTVMAAIHITRPQPGQVGTLAVAGTMQPKCMTVWMDKSMALQHRPHKLQEAISYILQTNSTSQFFKVNASHWSISGISPLLLPTSCFLAQVSGLYWLNPIS